MAHHGPNPFLNNDSEMRSLKEKLAEVVPPFGATGRFPGGRLRHDDEGELCFGITDYAGKVILDFGKPVAYLGMTPQQARDIAETLIHRADRAEAA